LQAWAKTVGPSPSICSLNRMPGLALATIDASSGLADRKRITPQVVAVQLDQVEGVEDFSSSRFRVDANSERASYFLANRWAIGGVGP
jgi:hypothetical protein